MNYWKKLYNLFMTERCQRRTIIEGPHTGAEAIFSAEGRQLFATDSTAGYGEDSLVEEITPHPHLVLFGAGHVNHSLYRLARFLDLKVTVIDNREQFCNKERFPEADIICTPYEKQFERQLEIPGCYIVIATHGHNYDTECVRYALKQNYHYLGMIGSRQKLAYCYEQLKKEGVSQKQIDTIHAPIGIKIGGNRPEEIAVSIIAEIISTYSEKKKQILINPDIYRKLSLESRPVVIVRVIARSGSSPASVGATLYVREDGSFEGTVGGGSIEKIAIEHAKRFKAPCTEHYNLDSKGTLGMACGGETTLLYTLSE